jgi:hypothetical protein
MQDCVKPSGTLCWQSWASRMPELMRARKCAARPAGTRRTHTCQTCVCAACAHKLGETCCRRTYDTDNAAAATNAQCRSHFSAHACVPTASSHGPAAGSQALHVQTQTAACRCQRGATLTSLHQAPTLICHQQSQTLKLTQCHAPQGAQAAAAAVTCCSVLTGVSVLTAWGCLVLAGTLCCLGCGPTLSGCQGESSWTTFQ